MTQWTAAEDAILRACRSPKESHSRLPHRTIKAVSQRRRRLGLYYQAPPRTPAHIVAYRGVREPHTPDECRVAQILSAVWRIAQREQVAVDVQALLAALVGTWREGDALEWAPPLQPGREVR